MKKLDVVAIELLRLNDLEVLANLTDEEIERTVENNRRDFKQGKSPFIVMNSIYIEARTEAQKRLGMKEV